MPQLGYKFWVQADDGTMVEFSSDIFEPRRVCHNTLAAYLKTQPKENRAQRRARRKRKKR